MPLHELLARIRWDPTFAGSRFVIGYWDRVERRVRHADLREVAWDPDNPACFDLIDEAGQIRCIPFHRVREVWRDGERIWVRHALGEPSA